MLLAMRVGNDWCCCLCPGADGREMRREEDGNAADLAAAAHLRDAHGRDLRLVSAEAQPGKKDGLVRVKFTGPRQTNPRRRW